MGPTANARIDSEYFSGQDQLSTTQHAGVQFTKSKNLKTNQKKRLIVRCVCFLANNVLHVLFMYLKKAASEVFNF